MPRTDYPTHRFKTEPTSAAVAKAIKTFSDDRRNLVRGIVSDAQRVELSSDQISSLRQNTNENDMAAAAAILESPRGLIKRKVTGLSQQTAARPHMLVAQAARLEAAYVSGFLNAWLDQSLSAVETISRLARMMQIPRGDALSALEDAGHQWGASSYLARKIAHVKEFVDLNDASQERLVALDATLGHHDHPQLQYAILGFIKESIPLFSLARRYSNIFASQAGQSYRQQHHLNNMIATPFSQSDCADFLLRAVQTSLIDTVAAVLTVINLRERFPDVALALEANLDERILGAIKRLSRELETAEPPDLLQTEPPEREVDGNQRDREDRSLSLYRRSAAFLEFKKLCRYRNDLDMVIGRRLVASLLPEISEWTGPSFDQTDILRRPNGDFQLCLHGHGGVKLDTFYRTYLFLRVIQDGFALSRLSSDDIQFVFDSTTGLESLLLESELKTMHLNASDDARALISVLALSLYRSKSSDPDIDFDFREQLESFITEHHSGDIPTFIESLAPRSPSVATYIATSLDETTLQKMYTIVRSPTAAEHIRKRVLTIVGNRLGKIEYIMEAEGIETRSKVATLKDYFDASRMFVDSFAMKKWLSSHPSAYTEQYKQLLPKIMARLSRHALVIDGEESAVDVVEFARTDEYLIERIAADAFKEFCTSNEFGIESYLGRRIRHNTLHGVMTNSVDNVLKRPTNQLVIAGTPFGRALALWEGSFKVYIERMRREFLQFREDSKPQALFRSDLDMGDVGTRRNLGQLVQTLRLTGAEMLQDLVISFCWQQVSPQLESASRDIRVTMAQQVTQSLDLALQRFTGKDEQRVRSELSAAIAAVFAQVAGWFQVPQTGFVPASISDICNIIDIEQNRAASTTNVDGEWVSGKYYGISVHRIYDCLAVLLQNAFKHGRKDSPVLVRVQSSPVLGTSLHALDLVVTSTLPSRGAEKCLARVDEAVTSTETGRDMVTEGYSGIKKVKFITRLNEGRSTVSYETQQDEISIRFQIKAEVIGGSVGDD